MKNKNIKELKKEYMEVPIPDELDFLVKKALKDSGAYKKKGNWATKGLGIAAAAVILAVGITTVGVNTNQAFASTLSKVPILGSLIKVVTFREYNVNENTYKADIKVPSVKGLDNNKALENSLNEKYVTENKKLYEAFMADMEKLKKNEGGHLGIKSGYEVKTDTDNILSIKRYSASTVNSYSSTKYDTIDKKNQVLITLPSLFKDDSYVKIISDNIKKQMIQQNNADSSKHFWVEGIEKNPNLCVFKEISKEQNFYINSENKLVICFDKYEVAPGAMGSPEFVIATDIISNVLVGNEYIK
ncbi:DUF3298 and DUF4163 domain-containing protein [Clostridium estertheticum]|uniref:DUF3298 and DUF4163 domain-containing protein n=1 Tax=Clostridium estertheticum TaxID=238834 RepID=UPI0013E941BE|nr:DUF3298 and DUF4163 domain-containing protein [Clostridium estertheticum]MBZ9685207.1 DUF3298 and DUF4163 domain-containing protein [Clostridium estertheticum]